MRAALRRPGQCAFCAFRTSEWTPSSFNWQNGSRRHRSNVKSSFSERGSVFGGEQPTVITPRWTFGGTRDRDGRGRYGFNDRYSKNRDGFRDRQNTYGKATTQPSPKQSAYDTFGELLMRECGFLKHKLLTSSDSPTKSWGFTSTSHFKAEFGRFTEDVIAAAQKASSHRIVSKEKNPLFAQLREAFIRGNIGGLAAELKYRFLASTIPESSTEPTLAFQQKVADLRHPVEWYPKTRALQRTIHLHVGPTNSGKTYHALKRLEEAKTGIYAGPLRLLAHEVYTRFNAKGKKCALITGEERRIPEGLDVMMHSCTVEMVPLNAKVEVAVIDEIQMMGDEERGWAWTQAFMGVEATEVHLCGELRTVQLISKLCTAMGDKLVIHKYERLGPLKLESRSLDGNLKKLQKGDAMILFSRVAIHAMKSNIEKLTGKRCAVVYGSLPPETRASQAALFNDPNNDYDFLVASNAVGMGLNLSIKRIIFESVSKHDGYAHRILKVPEINQIAGRAGRFKSAHQDVQRASTEVANDGSSLDVPKWDSKPNVGLVTTLNQFDFPTIEKGMSAQVEPLPTAGLLPPSDIIAKFASFFPSDTPFSYIILRLNELAVVNPDFHMCGLKDHVTIADVIQPYKMTIMDRITFLSAPVTLRDPGFTEVVIELAKCLSNQSGGELLDLHSFPLEILDQDIHDHAEGSKGYLRTAEMLHKALTLYLWLSYRFAGVFRSQALAFHVKALVEDKIDQCLAEIHFDSNMRSNLNRQRMIKLQQEEAEHKLLEDESLEDELDGDRENAESTAFDNEQGEEREDDEDDLFEIDESDEMGLEEDDGEAHDSEDSPSSDANIPEPHWEPPKPEVTTVVGQSGV